MIARSATMRRFAFSDAVRLVAAGILMIVALGAVLAVDALPGPFAGPGIIVGDLATVDIVAPRALTYESTEQTRLAREQARDGVLPQYDYSPERGQLTADSTARRARGRRHASRRRIRGDPHARSAADRPAFRNPRPHATGGRDPFRSRVVPVDVATGGAGARPGTDSGPRGARHAAERRPRRRCPTS